MSRGSVLRGPALILWENVVNTPIPIYTKDNVQVAASLDRVPINMAMYGKVDEFIKDRKIEITASPLGAWANRAALWPYGSTSIGTSVFTDDNRPLTLWTKSDAKKYKFGCCALTKMPSIKLSSIDTICGPATWTAIPVGGNTVIDMTLAAESSPFTDTSFSTDNIVKSGYIGKWIKNVAPNSAVFGQSWINTKDGFNIDFNLSLKPVETDGDGVIDMILDSLEVTVKFSPIGLDLISILNALPINGNHRGMSLRDINNADLVIIGSKVGDPKVTITGAQLVDDPLEFGMDVNRSKEMTFVATRKFTSGVAAPLFSLDVVTAQDLA